MFREKCWSLIGRNYLVSQNFVWNRSFDEYSLEIKSDEFVAGYSNEEADF